MYSLYIRSYYEKATDRSYRTNAAGKTHLSIALAKAVNGEIISADSMQVYKYMDIGSAKIRPEEMQGVKHYLVDELLPQEEFHIVKFQQMAKEAHLNLSVFHLVFSHIYGDTPYAYLKKYKMNLAAQWLSEDKMKIGDIALELGYSNASKFAKAFQSVYGMLPKDYRKNK